jgi:broad specificity phosphatase PhoE
MPALPSSAHCSSPPIRLPQIKEESFDSLFVSPLTRARQTADVVARDTGLTPRVLPALREIDLYSFQVIAGAGFQGHLPAGARVWRQPVHWEQQACSRAQHSPRCPAPVDSSGAWLPATPGHPPYLTEHSRLRTITPHTQGLVKAEGKLRFGDEWGMWQKDAAAFEIDGHAPVRELWHRGSAAWQHILTETGERPEGAEGRPSCALVVAHNAVNQALLGTALGLPPRFFRRLLQSNGATSVLDFEPPQGPGAPVKVTVDRLNQVGGGVRGEAWTRGWGTFLRRCKMAGRMIVCKTCGGAPAHSHRAGCTDPSPPSTPEPGQPLQGGWRRPALRVPRRDCAPCSDRGQQRRPPAREQR